MASGLDEVHAGMHPVVHDVHAVDLVLGLEIGIESLLDVLHDRPPRVIVVDEISKSRSINHSQTQADAVLFNVGTDRLDGYCLWDDVQAGSLAFARRI